MFANFCVFALLLSLACYATLGGRNENGQNVEENLIYEQVLEDIDLVEEEIESDVETDFVEETEYFTSCPIEEAEEQVQDVRTALECSFRKPKKLMRTQVAKRCAKARPSPCTYSMCDSAMEEDNEMGQLECARRTLSKPKLVKRIVKRVIPSTKFNVKPAEAEPCSPAVEPDVEEVLPENQEKPVEEEPKQSSKSEKQVKEETVKEAGKQKQKATKQSQKIKQKPKNQKAKEQKPGSTKSNKKSKQ